MTLKLACGAGTDHFDSERYLREREAFGSQIMGWRSAQTIDIYDQSRDGERTLSVLADYQRELAQRHYVPGSPSMIGKQCIQEDTSPRVGEEISANQSGEIVWIHDAETMAWIEQMQQGKGM